MSNLNVKLIFTAVTDQVKSAIDGVKAKFGELSGSADSSLNTVQQRINSSVSGVLSLGSAVKAFAAGFSILAVGNSIRGLIEMADGMRLVEGRVRNASDGAVDFAQNYSALVGISMQTGTALQENADMFVRLNGTIHDMGGSSQDTLRQVDLLSKSIKIAGATQAQGAAIMQQWSQAMASGRVSGDEFKTLMELNSPLMRRLAQEMGLTTGELRKMAEAQELSSNKVANALVHIGGVIDEEFKKIPVTIGTAMEKIKTAFGQYVADADRAQGATVGIASAFEGLAENIVPVADGLLTLAKLAAVVGFGSLVSSIVAYVGALQVAKSEAAAFAAHEEAAKAAMLARAQAVLAAAEATAADTTLKTLNIGTTQGIIAALNDEALSRLAVASAATNQQRAALAAIAANTASTGSTAALAAAQLALAEAEAQEAVVLADLEAIRLRSVQTTADLAAAEVAQAEATIALTAAQGKLATALDITNKSAAATKITLASLASAAMWGYVIYLVGEWLLKFKEVRLGVVVLVNEIIDKLQWLGLQIDLIKPKWKMKFTFSSEGVAKLNKEMDDLTAKYEAGKKSREEDVLAVFKYEEKQGLDANNPDAKSSPGGSKGGFSEGGAVDSLTKQQAEKANKIAKELLDSQLSQIKTKQDALKTAGDLELKQLDTNFKAAELALKQQGLSDVEFKEQRLGLEKSLAEQILEIKRKLVLDSAALEQQAINAKIKAVQSEVAASSVGGKNNSLGSLIAGGESSGDAYNAFNRGTSGNKILPALGKENLEQMTVGEIQARQALSIVNNDRLGAVGKYQVIASTLKEAVAALKLTADTKFDAATQERIFSEYLVDAKRPSIKQFVTGKTDNIQAVQLAASQEFASIENPNTGKSYYDKKGGNTASINGKEFESSLLASRSAYQSNLSAGQDESTAFANAVSGSGASTGSPEDQQAKNAKLEELNAQLVANKAATTAQLKSLGLDESQAEIAQQEQTFEVKKAISEQEKALALSAAEAEHAAQMDGLAAAEAASQQQLELGLIDNQQHLANLQGFAAQRLAIELGLVEAKRDLLGKERLALAQNTADEMAIRRKAAAEIKALNNKEALDKKAEFDKLFAPFENALDGMVSGVLTGQQTIGTAVKNTAQSITISYVAEFVKTRIRSAAEWAWQVSGFAGMEAKKKAIKEGGVAYDALLWVTNKAKMAAGWVWETLGFGAKETAKAGTKVASEAVQTGAQVTGDGIRTASTVAAATTSKAITATTSLSKIMSNAAAAAAGAYEAVVGIPIVGPILAPIAAGVAFAGVAAFGAMVGSAKGGEWEVGADGAPYILHKNESVLPAGVADNFRKVVGMVQGQTELDIGGAFGGLVASGKISKQLGLPEFASQFAGSSQAAANDFAKDRLTADKERMAAGASISKTEIHMNGIMVGEKDFFHRNAEAIVEVGSKQARNFNKGRKGR